MTRWADLLVDYCLRVAAGETIVIASEWEARPLVEACYRAVVLRGAHPLIRLDLPGLSEFFLQNASDAQLGHLPPVGLYEAETADARIRIAAESDTRGWPDRPRPAGGVGPGTRPDPPRRRSQTVVLTQYPTAAYAADAGWSWPTTRPMSPRRCSRRPDPVAAWQELGSGRRAWSPS